MCLPLSPQKGDHPPSHDDNFASIFEKGYTPRWTEEIFVVSEVRYTDPITYKLKDFNGEEIKGSFYEQELQKTTQELFRIEKLSEEKETSL